MDRLAELSRPSPKNRAETIDFTRTKSVRTERRDDHETRTEERASERERLDRAHDQPERFSQHLEAQRSPPDAPADAESPAETRPAAEGEQRAETETVESHTQPDQAHAAQPHAPNAESSEPVTPQIEAPAVDVSSLVGAPAKSETPAVEAAHASPRAVPLPAALTAALPAAASVSTAPNASPANEIQAVIPAEPKLGLEKGKLDGESSTASIGAARTDGSSHPVQVAHATREVKAEAPVTEAPREAPAVRTAQEIERAADILRQIRVQLTPELSAARIQLHPLELGRVSIHLTLEEGRMKTIVRAERPETLQAIQTHLPELRASLRQHGIDAREFQLALGFENRERRDDDKPSTPSSSRTTTVESTNSERSPTLHAALVKTGVDFYA